MGRSDTQEPLDLQSLEPESTATFRWTLRSAALAFACVIGISIGGVTSAFLRYDLIGTGHLPRCALYPVLVIILFNAVLRRWFGSKGFSRGEMLLVYCTIMVMSGIPGQQMATYLYLGIIGPIYYATPQNKFADPEVGFHKYIPDWMVPSKNPDDPVIRWMFEGMPEGIGWRDIPWGKWLVPMAMWTPFVVAIFFVTMCICVILRRQWVDRERLLFPLAQVPLEITDAPEGAAAPPIFKSRIMWGAAIIPILVYFTNGIKAYIDGHTGNPVFNLYPWWIGNLFSDKPWNVFNWLPTQIYFGMAGIAYIMTAEVGFSFWFFTIFQRVQMLFRVTLGMSTDWGTFQMHNLGAYVFLVGAYAWVMRRHLKDVLRKAFGRADDVDDSNEPLGYRSAVWGIILGMGFICFWCYLAASRDPLAIFYALGLFIWYFLSMIFVTRIIAEAGMFVYWVPISPQGMVINCIGSPHISGANLTMLQMVGWIKQDSATAVMPQALQGMKIAGEAKMNKRSLFVMLLIAMIVAVLACHIPALYIAYKHSVPNFGWWTKNAAWWETRGLADTLRAKHEFRADDFASMGIGGAFTAFLVFMRRRFLWWPFHPLGYAGVGAFGRYWFSILLGWIAKVIITWLGGVKLWRRIYPAAIGLIVGETLILFSWLLFHFIYPINGVLIIE